MDKLQNLPFSFNVTTEIPSCVSKLQSPLDIVSILYTNIKGSICYCDRQLDPCVVSLNREVFIIIPKFFAEHVNTQKNLIDFQSLLPKEMLKEATIR